MRFGSRTSASRSHFRAPAVECGLAMVDGGWFTAISCSPLPGRVFQPFRQGRPAGPLWTRKWAGTESLVRLRPKHGRCPPDPSGAHHRTGRSWMEGSVAGGPRTPLYPTSWGRGVRPREVPLGGRAKHLHLRVCSPRTAQATSRRTPVVKHQRAESTNTATDLRVCEVT